LRSPEIHLEPVLGEPFVVALPSGHPLEACERVSLEAVAEEDLIFFSRRLEPGFHEQIVELLGRVGALPRVAQYAVHLQTAVSLVASKIGVSILPASSAQVRWEGVVYRPLDAPDAASWLGLARLERDRSALVENFVRTVRELAETEGLSDYPKPGSTPQGGPRR
jgi:DNA-binding transcriptional LysR family regulator